MSLQTRKKKLWLQLKFPQKNVEGLAHAHKKIPRFLTKGLDYSVYFLSVQNSLFLGCFLCSQIHSCDFPIISQTVLPTGIVSMTFCFYLQLSTMLQFSASPKSYQLPSKNVQKDISHNMYPFLYGFGFILSFFL